MNRQILLKKLSAYGLKSTVLRWFTSWLSNGMQCAKSCGVTSTPTITLHVVPQGMALGPLHFHLYVTEVVDAFQICKNKISVDDTNGLMVKISYNLTEHLDNISNYLTTNSLLINVQK